MPETLDGTRVITVRPHFPTAQTRDDVVNLVAFGTAEATICAIMHCTLHELREHYAMELEHGLAKINAQVGLALLHSALYERDVNAQKFWLHQRAGWLREGDKPKPDAEAGEMMTITERRVVVERIMRMRPAPVDSTVVETVPAKVLNGANGVKHK